jgi:hypothetical protein
VEKLRDQELCGNIVIASGATGRGAHIAQTRLWHGCAAGSGAMHQPLSNVAEILQYARDSRFKFELLAKGGLPEAIAEPIGVTASGH